MTEDNPHRRIARIFAFACYILAGFVLFVGVFFTLASATMNTSRTPFEGVTNLRMAIMTGSMFLIVALIIILFGWGVQSLFGQRRRQEKLAAKSAVGCLRLGSLGCGLWTLLTAIIVLMTGKLLTFSDRPGMPPTGIPAGIQDIFVGASGSVLAITLMLSVAWFISATFVRPTSKERERIYHAYLSLIQPKVLGLADPETRAYVQEQTMEVLPKLDATLKSNLLGELSKSELLTGNTRIVLRNADFRRVDLCLIHLPQADLREINLEEAKLEGATLHEVNLHKAKLKKADLSRARLQKANLQRADLTGAVLEEAKLREADFTEAVLKGADLSQADLQGANLQRADLTGAVLKKTDLRGADLSGTVVTPAQLRQAKLLNGPT